MNIATMAAASAAARRGAAQKRITRRLREMGATRRETAQLLPEVPRTHRRDVERLIERGVIRQARPGTYYLDEQALSDLHSRNRTIAFGILVLGAGLVALLTLTR